MSLVIHYQDGKLVKAQQVFERKTPSPVYAAKDGKTFVMGEVFGASYEDVAGSNWREEPDALNSFSGALSIVYADDRECIFATDLNGIETWYTYHRGSTFIISDDFWDIIKIVKPTFEDIDQSRTRGSLVAITIDGETFIKGLKIVYPFTIAKYDPEKNELETRRYLEFKYSGEVTDVNEAVENMDRIINDAMKNIKETCGDVKYGVGVSGGLDSRVIPHYAQNNGMELVGFNICVPKPHKLFKARSCKNAEKIADAFKIPYTNTKWNPSNVEEKIKASVVYYPLGAGRNSFKYEQSMPEFDVLLTGGSGLIVGSMLPERINEFTRDEMINHMLSFFNRETNSRTFASRAARGFNYIFGTKFSSESKSIISEVVTEEDLNNAKLGIINFIDNGIKAGQTNLEIYEDFFSNVLGFRNRYGAYESIFGRKRSFSIYVPFMLKETLRWSPELLFDRKVLKALIIDKIPEVKNIKSELFEPAPNRKTAFFSKLSNMIEFLLRGNGAAVDDYWMKKKSLKKKLAKRLNNECTWFGKIFNVSDSKELTKKLTKSNETELMIGIWELKTLLDYIENEEYMNFDLTETI